MVERLQQVYLKASVETNKQTYTWESDDLEEVIEWLESMREEFG